MAEQDPQGEAQRVPARRMRGAGAVDVFIGADAYQINEGEILEVGVWPWELTEAHGWERVTRREVRAAAQERAQEPEPAATEPEPEPEQAEGVA